MLSLVIDTNSRRICAVRIAIDCFRLLLINVYMPYEGDDRMTDEYAYQWFILDATVMNNLHCYIIAGGNFNVGLSRPWVQTAMPSSFCSNTDLNFALHHDNA